MIIKKHRKKSAEEGAEQVVPQQNQEEVEVQQEKEIDLFDLDNIDFITALCTIEEREPQLSHH